MNARSLIGRLRLPRDGRATVSLEGLLTGVSVWLAFNLLLNDRAEASPANGSPLPGSALGEGSSDGGGGVVPSRPMRGAHRSAPRRPTDPGSELGDLADEGDGDSGPAVGHRGNGGASRRGLPLGAEATLAASHRPIELLPAPLALGGAPRTTAAWGGSASGPMAFEGDSGEPPPVVVAGSAPAQASAALIAVAPPSPPAPVPKMAPALAAPLAAPPPRASGAAVVGEETFVARSFSGPAVVRAQSSQVALNGTTIDARESTTERMEVVSSRRLHSLAASTLGAADLGFDGATIGAKQAQLWAGEHTKAIRIQGLDDLHFALAGAAPSTAQIRHQTMAMERSTLRADGGVDALALSALMDLDVDLQGHLDTAGLSLQFATVAMRDSEVILGDKANKVAIHSGYTSLRTSSPEGTLDLSGSLEAVGMANSRITTDGGNDEVRVVMPMPTLQAHEAIGLLGSTVDLGEGDDLLVADGAVIRSTIRPGGGNNRIQLEGRVEDSTITLHPESTNSVTLGSLADVLTLDTEGPAWIQMALGDGADTLHLATPSLSGWIDGGVGEDRFLFGWGAPPADSPMPAAAPAGPLQISGGGDRDLFLFNRPEASSEGLGWKPQLTGLALSLDGAGGIGLTDRIGWFGATIEELTPSDSLGIGNPSLLPIAPLGLLMEGIRSGRATTDQLAIALTDRGGELLMIRGDGRTLPLVDLPDLRT